MRLFEYINSQKASILFCTLKPEWTRNGGADLCILIRREFKRLRLIYRWSTLWKDPWAKIWSDYISACPVTNWRNGIILLLSCFGHNSEVLMIKMNLLRPAVPTKMEANILRNYPEYTVLLFTVCITLDYFKAKRKIFQFLNYCVLCINENHYFLK